MNHRGPSYGFNTRPAGAGGNASLRPVGEHRTARPVPSDERSAQRLRPKRYNSAPEPTYGPQPDPLKPKRKVTKKVDKKVVEAAKAEAAKRGISL